MLNLKLYATQDVVISIQDEVSMGKLEVLLDVDSVIEDKHNIL